MTRSRPRVEAGDLLGRRQVEAGDLLIAEAAATLARLRDRLAGDGYAEAAELVADLVEAASDFLAGRERRASAR